MDVTAERVTFTFLASQSTLREWVEQARTWLESTAERLMGRKMIVTAVLADAVTGASGLPAATPPAAAAPAAEPAAKRDLKAEAMSSSAVQAMLDVFPAEIRDVEEMKDER